MVFADNGMTYSDLAAMPMEIFEEAYQAWDIECSRRNRAKGAL
jgi:hypothetical protein